MQTSASKSQSLSTLHLARPAIASPWFMLVSRSVLFLFFQILIALTIAVTEKRSLAEAWNKSARWWTFIAFLANFASIYLLVRLFNAEGKHFFDILRFSRETWKIDLLWFLDSPHRSAYRCHCERPACRRYFR